MGNLNLQTYIYRESSANFDAIFYNQVKFVTSFLENHEMDSFGTLSQKEKQTLPPSIFNLGIVEMKGCVKEG